MNQPSRQNRNKNAAASQSGGSSMNAEVISGRTMPESLEAEAAVLGSMILDPECIGLVIQKVKTDSFYRLEHQMMFDAIVHLWEKTNGQFDLVLLRDELKKRSQIDEVGGPEYLMKIAESVPSSANVEQYVNIVQEKQMLRELISAAGEVMTEAFDVGGDVSEKLDRAEQKIFQVTEKKISGAAVSIKDLLTQAFEAIDKREGHHVTGLPTGFMELDELTCGLQNGEMIIIAGRPSMGKTSFAMNMAEHIGADNKMPVVIFSLEMSKQQLAERMLCSRAKIDSQLVRKGMLNDEQYQELVHAASELSDKPIYVDDSPGLTPLELRGKARRLKAQYGIRCIFVDYLQLMSTGGRIESRQQEVSEISRYLKGLARELEVPVIVLSQLNRSPEGRADHKPFMSDLRESGSIEQDADVVMLLHREDYYHKGDTASHSKTSNNAENTNNESFETDSVYKNTNIAEVIIAKQRNGPTDTIKLVFNGMCTRFEDLSKSPGPF